MKTIKRMTLLTMLLAVVVIVSSKKGHAQESKKERPRIKYIEIKNGDTTKIDKYVDELTEEDKARMKFDREDFESADGGKAHVRVYREHDKSAKDHEKTYKIQAGAGGKKVWIEKEGKGKYKTIVICGDSLKGNGYNFKMDSDIVIINTEDFVIPPMPPMPPMDGMNFNFTVPPVPPMPPLPGLENLSDMENIIDVKVEEDKEKGTKRIIIEMKTNSDKSTPDAEEKKEKEKSKKKMSNKGPEEISPAPASSSDLKIYPNPSSGLFNLAFEIKEKGEINVSVTDISGKEVYKESFNDNDGGYYRHAFDLRDKPNGVYIITVEQNGKKEVVRFVKES